MITKPITYGKLLSAYYFKNHYPLLSEVTVLSAYYYKTIIRYLCKINKSILLQNHYPILMNLQYYQHIITKPLPHTYEFTVLSAYYYKTITPYL